MLVVARTEGMRGREGIRKHKRQTRKTSGDELERGGRLVHRQTVLIESCV